MLKKTQGFAKKIQCKRRAFEGANEKYEGKIATGENCDICISNLHILLTYLNPMQNCLQIRVWFTHMDISWGFVGLSRRVLCVGLCDRPIMDIFREMSHFLL